MGTLDGKVALVTGAARGQGRSHAVKFAEEGASVIAVDLAGAATFDTIYHTLGTEEDLAMTAKAVEAAGSTVIARQVDVRSQEQLDAVVAEAKNQFGRLDIVVANAGINAHFRRAWELSDAEWQDVIDVDLTGTWRTVKATIPAMIEAGNGGSITLTSSLAGQKGYPHMGAYTAAKHGITGLMKVLANELAEYSIRVNTVLPGTINTRMAMNEATFAVFRPDLENPTQEDASEVFRAMHALPVKWLESREVSEAIAWLASDAARYITGVELPVDAGVLVKV